MANTIVLGNKPIQMPEMNANLLSMISLIVLCAMMSMTVFGAVAAGLTDC